MEDFTSPARFFQHGSLNVPWHDDLVMQLIAIDDIGAFAALAFAHPDAYLGRAMETTGDKLTTPQTPAVFTTAPAPPVPPTQTPRTPPRVRDPRALQPPGSGACAATGRPHPHRRT